MHSTERVLTSVNFPYLYKVYSSDIILVFNREYTFTKQFTLKTTFLSRKVFLYFFKQMSSTEIVTCQQVEIYTKNRPNIYIYIYLNHEIIRIHQLCLVICKDGTLAAG